MTKWKIGNEQWLSLVSWDDEGKQHIYDMGNTVLLEVFTATLFHWFAHSGLYDFFAETYILLIC